MDKATIFDIRRHSLHDGPGIRTSVFFKGCPLSCLWCHNPEGMGFDSEIEARPERCISCGLCKGLINKRQNFYSETDFEYANNCPSTALEIIGKKYSVPELLDIICEDEVFYRQTNLNFEQGGVTFTGGEPLAQGGFVTEAAKACKAEAIHVAIDTCGYVSSQTIRSVLPYADLWLFDIKHIDDDKHNRLCSVSNKLILSNLKLIADYGANIIISIPLIPTLNDDLPSIKKTAKFITELRTVGSIKVRILPYHNSAIAKYERRNEKYRALNIPLPDPSYTAVVQNIFLDAGIPTVIGGL